MYYLYIFVSIAVIIPFLLQFVLPHNKIMQYVLNIILYITDIDKYHKLNSSKLDKITQAITQYWQQLVDKVNNKNLENTKDPKTHIESEDFTKVIKEMRKNIDKNEALNDIYKILRPGEAPTIEVAEQVFKNLYFVGAGTHPGAGMPGVLSSAKVLDELF